MKWMRMMVSVAMMAGLATTVGAAPTVSNVRATQRSGQKVVDIYYNLVNPAGGVHFVSVIAEANGASVPANALSGNVGAGVSAGTDRHIVWNVGADWTGHYTDLARVKVTASDYDPANAEMILIPAGTNNVVVAKAFYIGKYEVTGSLWNEVYAWATNHGYQFDNPGTGNLANSPVTTVNWYDVVKWCNARSEREGLAPCYYVGYAVYRTGQAAPDWDWTASGFRLPRENEWEYAARGGLVGMTYPWGNDIDCSRANYGSCWVGTIQVGYYAPNGYGLYDMAGNVWEWCFDWYSVGSARVMRGGGWDSVAGGCAVSVRCIVSPYFAYGNYGFRLARSAGQ